MGKHAKTADDTQADVDTSTDAHDGSGGRHSRDEKTAPDTKPK